MKHSLLCRILSLGLALVLFAAIATACSGSSNGEGDASDTSGKTDPTTTTTTGTTKPPRGNLNPLTGLYNLPNEAVGKRPVSFMVNNIRPYAQPQAGISEADIIFEALAEGGITRLLAIFPNYKKLPKVMPIRSARDYYLDFAAPLDTLFVHWGASSFATTSIRERKLDNIDGLVWGQWHFKTDYQVAAQKGAEHSRYMVQEGFNNHIEYRKMRTDSKAKGTAFAFVDPDDAYVPAEQKVSHAQVFYSYGYDAEFDYDEPSKTYWVSQFGAKHIDKNNNKQLAFDNVLILYVDVRSAGTKDGKIRMDLTKGSGVYLSRGGGMALNWKKGHYENNFTFSDKSGKAVALNPGQTYVCMVPTSYQSRTILQAPVTTAAPTQTTAVAG